MPPQPPTVDVSVIIINWNTRQLLEDCLASLPGSGVAHSLEAIVVDNNSTDGSQEMVRQKYPQVKLICNPSNVGFAHGNNQGIRASSGRYVSLVNSDVKVLPSCHDKLVDYMDANQEIGIAGPRVLNGDLTLQSSCRRFPNLWNNVCDAFAFRRFFPTSAFFAGEHMLYFKHDRIIFPDVLVGCFLFARTQAVQEFGLLDEDFFMYGEDINWCLRCWKSGWKIAFYPEAEAIHYQGGSSNSDPTRFAVAQQRARQQLWKKHYSRLACFGLACLLATENTLRWLLTAISALLRIKPHAEAAKRKQRHAACMKALLFPERTQNVVNESSSISRLREFHRTHGTRVTMQRFTVALQRAASRGQMVLFACDLPVKGAPAAMENLERKQTEASLSAADLERLVSHWNPDAMRRLIAERFAASAELWLLRENGIIAACGWTLKGKTMEPHYFPLQPGDVHLFDFFVFPEFRGRGLNPALVWQILTALSREGLKRALIEAAAWNKPQLSSLKKTPFQKLGIARKSLWGKTTVMWSGHSDK